MIIRIMMTDSATVSALQKMIPRKSLTRMPIHMLCMHRYRIFTIQLPVRIQL